MVTKETAELIERYEKELQSAQLTSDRASLGQQQQELNYAEDDRNIIKEQLDLGDVLDRMHNLLRGRILKKVKGVKKWCKPDNNDMVVLSDYGVSYCMWMLQAYLTKNTLLSNYDDQQIAAKMEDFSTTIADDIFMEYDKMFLYPTLEDCKDEIKKRIENKVETKQFANELLGITEDEKVITDKIKKEMEGRIEREMDVIRAQKIKNKLKRFESLLRMIQDTVHSAYQRAWKGQERTTLRQHINISETRGGIAMPQNNHSFNPFKR
jgi:hypothetical protein